MRCEWFMSIRYLFARRREKFISVISLISVLGIAIGVCALIVVISVMSGFDTDLRDKIIGANAHIEIERIGGLLPQEQEHIKTIEEIAHVKAVTMNFSGQAIVQTKAGMTGVLVKGIDPAREVKVTKLGEYVSQKPLALGEKEVIVGSELAKKLNIIKGDMLEVYTISQEDPVALKVVNLYHSGMYDFDSLLIFVTLKEIKSLYVKQSVSGTLSVKLDSPLNAAAVARQIENILPLEYSVRTWEQTNRELFSALKLEKTVMFVILTLIILVACFNIAATLIMGVMEKTKDIGILKAIGAKNSTIMWIFCLEGFLLGCMGTLLGAGGGLGICYLLKKYDFIRLPQDIYYIQHLPVKVQIMDCVCIVCAALVLSLVATLYPAIQASRFKPVDALRYE